MPTNNPKVSAYIPQPVFDRFKAFYEEKGISMSQAVAVIFSEYFQIELPVDRTISTSGLLVARFQCLEYEFAEFKELVEHKFQDLTKMFSEPLINQNSGSQIELLEKNSFTQVLERSSTSEPPGSKMFQEELSQGQSSSSSNESLNEPLLIDVLTGKNDVGDEVVSQSKESYSLQSELPISIPSEPDYELTIEQLAERIGTTKSSFSVQKSKSKTVRQFGDWIQYRDPNKIRWVESDRRRRMVYYKPDSSTPQELLDELLNWKSRVLN